MFGGGGGGFYFIEAKIIGLVVAKTANMFESQLLLMTCSLLQVSLMSFGELLTFLRVFSSMK